MCKFFEDAFIENSNNVKITEEDRIYVSNNWYDDEFKDSL